MCSVCAKAMHICNRNQQSASVCVSVCACVCGESSCDTEPVVGVR